MSKRKHLSSLAYSGLIEPLSFTHKTGKWSSELQIDIDIDSFIQCLKDIQLTTNVTQNTEVFSSVSYTEQ